MLSPKVLLPPVDEKLRMRPSNKTGLRIGPCKQVASLPRCCSKHAVDDRSLLLRGDFYGLMNRGVLRRFEQKKLIQTESQNVPDISLNTRTAQTTDPKIE